MIIGLSGKIGVGKTELCNMILDCRNENELPCVRIAFGDLVKEEAAAQFGFPLEWCYCREGKERVVSVPEKFRPHIMPVSELTQATGGKRAKVRTVLQFYGTDWTRRRDPEYWTRAMRDAASWEISKGNMVIADDVRFPNEKDLITELGGLNIRILPWEGWKPGPYADHESETALDGRGHFWDLKLHGPEFSQLPRIAGLIYRVGVLKRWKHKILHYPETNLFNPLKIDNMTHNTLQMIESLTQDVESQDEPSTQPESSYEQLA